MLEKVNLKKTISKEEYEKKLEKLGVRLGELQREIRDAGIPVIIDFEGFRGSLRGTIISKLTQVLDPRSYRVLSMSKNNELNKKLPFFAYFWKNLPRKGFIRIYHRGWYFLKNEHEVGDPDEADKWYDVPWSRINSFEKALTDDNYEIIKIFTYLSKKQQKDNIDNIEKLSDSVWEQKLPGGIEGADYKAYYKAYENMLSETNTVNAPWYVIPVEDLRYGIIEIFSILAERLEKAVEKAKKRKTTKAMYYYKKDKTIPNVLADYNPDQEMDEKTYRTKLKEYRKRLQLLQLGLYIKGVSTIVGFEGWDAGGKGGAIRRLTSALDPMGFNVYPVSAPNAVEREYNHLWRFWIHIPNPGEVAIFDRTWYGRVMVERIEHFATAEEWKRAYQEINDMEQQWADQNIIVNKFWLQISSDEQLKRFTARSENPDKQWKITDEDWRNRDKWGAYEEAVNEMLFRTDTKYAPWTVIEANNKYYARLKVMKTMIDRYEKALLDLKSSKDDIKGLDLEKYIEKYKEKYIDAEKKEKNGEEKVAEKDE